MDLDLGIGHEKEEFTSKDFCLGSCTLKSQALRFEISAHGLDG